MEYSEEQRFRNTFMYIMLGAAMLVMLGGIGFSMVQTIQSSGQVPSEIYYSISFSVLLLGLVIFFIFRITLYTSVDSGGFRYRYPPLIRNTRTIPFDNIMHWRVRTLQSLGEFGGFGHRRLLLRKKTAIVMGSKMGIELELEKGKKLIFSTTKPDALKEVMQRYIPNKELV